MSPPVTFGNDNHLLDDSRRQLWSLLDGSRRQLWSFLDDMRRRSSFALDGSRHQLFTRARSPISIHEHAHATSAHQRGGDRAALEIVPLVLVEGPENFGRVEAPHFTSHAPSPGDEAGECAEMKERADDGPVVHERDASGEEAMRGLAAHQRAVEEEVARPNVRAQAA